MYLKRSLLNILGLFMRLALRLFSTGALMPESVKITVGNLLNTITTDEAERTALVDELLKANEAILEMAPIKKTKDVINANLSDTEQGLLPSVLCRCVKRFIC